MRHHSTETVDKAVCTEEGGGGGGCGGGGAARLEAVVVELVERKARALHAETRRRRARRLLNHPLLLLLRDVVHDESEASIVESPGDALPQHWCEREGPRGGRKNLQLRTELNSPEQLELERRRRRRRRRHSPRHAHTHTHAHPKHKHRTLLVSAIDEQAKVIHVLDPDELPRRARYTIMVTACLLLFLCLLLVGVTLRMAPLIDDMVMGKRPHNVSQLSVTILERGEVSDMVTTNRIWNVDGKRIDIKTIWRTNTYFNRKNG